MVAVEIAAGKVVFDPLAEVRVHPAAELFPLLEGFEFAALVADISENGLREPIVFTPDGQLLDGRNRYRACKKIRDEEPTTRVEHSEPWAYVVSVNLHRRHLNESQRSMVAGKIAERAPGRPGKAPIGPVSSSPPPTKVEAAAMLNVGTSSVHRARQVLKHGVKGLQQAVESGKVPVSTAARVAAEMAPAEQERFVERINNGDSPRKIAPPATDRGPAAVPDTTGLHRGHNKSHRRHRYLSAAALDTYGSSMRAMAQVLSSAEDSLDPSISPEQAQLWMGELSGARRTHNQVLDLLTTRAQQGETA